MKTLKVFKKPSIAIADDLDCYGYELTFPNQKFVMSYMHPLLPYRGMLLAYQLGNGKTYAAAALAHLYTTYGFEVLFLSHNLNVMDNFKNEYIKFVKKHKLKDNIKKIKIMGLTKFFIRKPKINGGLVIIDEAHNLRENANRYHDIKESLSKIKNIKILVITATPMIDSVEEFDSLRSLIEESAPIAYSETKAIKMVEKNYVGKDMGFGKLMLSEMKGLQLEGYKNAINSLGNYDVYTQVRQASLSMGPKYNKNIPLIDQSAKAHVLVNCLKEGQLTTVFCFYISRGIDFMADALSNHVDDKGNLVYEQWSPQMNDNESKKKRRFAVITGRTSETDTTSIIQNFNSIMNINGSIIEVLLGSSVLNESITLKNVRHVHVLTPFWNYGQAEQAIGRTVRIGSHDTLPKEERNINIYLHASYIPCYPTSGRIMNNERDITIEGKDIEMWETSWKKKQSIDAYIKRAGELSIWTGDWTPSSSTEIPPVDGMMVIKVNDIVWDLRHCFETNRSKISWCKVDPCKAIGYKYNDSSRSPEENEIILGPPPDYIKIITPLPNGYTVWCSCIDQKLRITNNTNSNSSKKKICRGLLITNITESYKQKIAADLNVPPSMEAIYNALKNDNRYFDSQIKIIHTA